MKKLILLFIFLLSLTSCNKESQVSNVSATSYIVIEQKPSKNIIFAANELKKYLKKLIDYLNY